MEIKCNFVLMSAFNGHRLDQKICKQNMKVQFYTITVFSETSYPDYYVINI